MNLKFCWFWTCAVHSLWHIFGASKISQSLFKPLMPNFLLQNTCLPTESELIIPENVATASRWSQMLLRTSLNSVIAISISVNFSTQQSNYMPDLCVLLIILENPLSYQDVDKFLFYLIIITLLMKTTFKDYPCVTKIDPWTTHASLIDPDSMPAQKHPFCMLIYLQWFDCFFQS